MKKLTILELQTLENLTGKQYTIYGQLRKNQRSLAETLKLGIVNDQTRRADHEDKMLELIELTEDLWSDEFVAQALAQGFSEIDIEWMREVVSRDEEYNLSMMSWD